MAIHGDHDIGFGFGGSGNLMLISSSIIKIGGTIGFDLDLPFRIDNHDHVVTTLLVSPHAGIKAEILLTAKNDLILYGGYRFAGKTSSWEYSHEEKTHSAVWDDGAPEIDISGYFISVGYKIIIF